MTKSMITLMVMAVGLLGFGRAVWAPVWTWSEDSVSIRPESSSQNSINNSWEAASSDSGLETSTSSGTGYLYESDEDWYFIGSKSSSTHEFIKINISSTSGGWVEVHLYENEGSDHRGSGNNQRPIYYQIPETPKDIYIQVRGSENTEYSINMERVNSGTITGRVNLLEVGSSAANNVNIETYDFDGTQIS
ncbi:hypothetical protein KAR10_01440 [bacterium]|nr:hypothetical protein [bacterium]